MRQFYTPTFPWCTNKPGYRVSRRIIKTRMSIKYCNNEAHLVVVSSCAMSHGADINVKHCFFTQPPLGADGGTTRGCLKHCQPNILIDSNVIFG
ncbi:hypothetical protein FKM82_027269 [Ascaphus truei]